MTIKQALKKYPSVEVDLLLSYILGKPREFLYMEPAYQLSANQLISLQKLVRRREKGEPIAYIIGYKDFAGLRFKVNKNVLIPRPETEWLVEAVVQARGLRDKQKQAEGLRYKNGKIKILDLGTGSGCIAVSLVKLCNGNLCTVTASDISAKALVVAKQNAKMHSAKIKFVRSDLLENIKQDFDIIIANLPYVWKGWENNTSAETVGLKFEPKKALFTVENGLKEIRRLLEQIAVRKNKPRLVYLEFDPRQKTQLAALIKNFLPQAQTKFYKDFNNFRRFVEIKSC